jgi:hypothetical protein
MNISWRGVRGGTAVGNKSLCENCEHSHIIKGQAVSEKITRCSAMYDATVIIPFTISECNKHENRLTPSVHDMEKIAYILESDARGKPIGFKTSSQFRKDNNIEKHNDLVDI